MLQNPLFRHYLPMLLTLISLNFTQGWAQKPVAVKTTEKADESKTVAAPSELSKSGNSESLTAGNTTQANTGQVAPPEPTANFKSNRKSTLETGINLGDTATVVLPYLRYRYFLNKTWAIRGHLEASHITQTSYYYDTRDKTNTGKKVQNSFSFGCDLGIEYHLPGTKRLSPYFGALVGIGVGSNRETWTDYYDGNLNIDTLLPMGYVYGFNYSGSTPNFRLVIGAVAGFDYYLTERIYTGLELGWAFQYSNQNRGDYTWDLNGVRRGGGFLDNQFKTSTSGFAAQPTVRVGWRF